MSKKINWGRTDLTTRDGRKYRNLCMNVSRPRYPVVGLVDGLLDPIMHSLEGKWDGDIVDSKLDIIEPPATKEITVYVYRLRNTKRYFVSESRDYDSSHATLIDKFTHTVKLP